MIEHDASRRCRLAARLLTAVLLAVALATGPATAQAPTIDPMTPDATVDVEALGIALKPLPKTQLEEAITAWLGLLQEKATAVANAEIAQLGGTAEADAAAQVQELRDERTAVVDRFETVLAAYAAKGGEIEEHERYVAAVSGLKIDATNASAAWQTIQAWATSKEGGVRWAKNVGLFLAVLLVSWIVAGIVSRIVRKAVARTKAPSELLKEFLCRMAKWAVLLVGLVVALDMLEVKVGPFMAALGAAGFIIGFAVQGTLSNFAAGIMILLYHPFDIGDVVEVAGVSGKVEAMTLVSTTIKTFDNQVVIVPNNTIWGDVITNVTGSDTRRVDLVFGIGYGDDVDRATTVLTEIVAKHPKVLATPEPVIKLSELADSSVNFIVRPWAKTGDYWDVYWDLTREVKTRFDAEGISIPFPQRDVHVQQVPVQG